MGSKAKAADDCFAHFDAAFATLAAELESVPADAGRTPPPTPAPAPELVQPQAVEIRPVREAADTAPPQSFGELEDAFDKLDAELARVGPGLSSPDARPLPLTNANVSATPWPVAPPAHRLTDADLWQPRANGGTPLERLLGTLDNLSRIQGALQDPGVDTGLSREAIGRVCADARAVCDEFAFPSARARADFALLAFDEGHADTLPGEIAELVRHIRHDARSCSIVPVAKNRGWTSGLTLGEQAAAGFPSAVEEMAEGSRCFDLGQYSACVFHMVSAAEYGLRALASAADARMGGSARQFDWTTLLIQIDSRVVGIDKWRAGPAKAAALEFFADALHEARGLHHAARKLANATHAFDEQQAIAVGHAARDFLVRLSARISEAHARPLTRRDFARIVEDAARGPDRVAPGPRAGPSAARRERDVAADAKAKTETKEQ